MNNSSPIVSSQCDRWTCREDWFGWACSIKQFLRNFVVLSILSSGCLFLFGLFIPHPFASALFPVNQWQLCFPSSLCTYTDVYINNSLQFVYHQTVWSVHLLRTYLYVNRSFARNSQIQYKMLLLIIKYSCNPDGPYNHPSLYFYILSNSKQYIRQYFKQITYLAYNIWLYFDFYLSTMLLRLNYHITGGINIEINTSFTMTS